MAEVRESTEAGRDLSSFSLEEFQGLVDEGMIQKIVAANIGELVYPLARVELFRRPKNYAEGRARIDKFTNLAQHVEPLLYNWLLGLRRNGDGNNRKKRREFFQNLNSFPRTYLRFLFLIARNREKLEKEVDKISHPVILTAFILREKIQAIRDSKTRTEHNINWLSALAIARDLGFSLSLVGQREVDLVDSQTGEVTRVDVAIGQQDAPEIKYLPGQNFRFRRDGIPIVVKEGEDPTVTFFTAANLLSGISAIEAANP